MTVQKLAPILLYATILGLVQLIKPGVIPGHILFALLCMSLIVVLSVVPYRFLVNRFTVEVGKLSFSLYLVHFAVLFWMNQLRAGEIFTSPSADFFFRYIVLVILSLPVAWLTYTLIEQPGISMGKGLITKLENARSYVALESSPSSAEGCVQTS